jgi:hypothetical protein
LAKVTETEVSALVADGERFAMWTAAGRRAGQPRAVILDVKTGERRRISLPRGCRQGGENLSASDGLALLYCRGAKQYVVELTTGAVREIGAATPGYRNFMVGRHWIRGEVNQCASVSDCVYLENRATGEVVRKPLSPAVNWNLDARLLAPLLVCGSRAPTALALHQWLDGDLYVMLKGGLRGVPTRIRRCGGKLVLLATRAEDINVSGGVVVWSTFCDERDPAFARCSPRVRAQRMRTGRRVSWSVPGASARAIVSVNQIAGHVFGLRATARDSSSFADPSRFALYGARIPK